MSRVSVGGAGVGASGVGSGSAGATSAVNINNLNITTFIKDIYLSLKHIDTCFSTFKTDIDARMMKLEGQYETILERLNQIDSTINQVKKFRLTDAELIKRDLLNHFAIRKGEKLENPNFGTII